MRAGLAVALIVVALLFRPGTGRSQEQLGELAEGPFLLSADEVIYDENLGTVIAAGNVEISTEERVLLADSVSYNLRDGVVSASGNISLLEPTGEVVFADYLELDKALTEGVIESVRVLLTDNSRLAANTARRFDEDRTELARAVYSPCDVCQDHPERAPLWQIRASRVTHRRSDQRIVYRDAVLQVAGAPVFYTPYFSHPDPTVERKTGFLSPSFGNDSQLGFRFDAPFFWAIDPHRDLTLSPFFTSEEGPVFVGEYRAATERGGYEGVVSFTRPDRRGENNERLEGQVNRAHIDAQGRFDLDPIWRWGFDLQRSTDDTYLKRYRFTDVNELVSDVFIEGFDDRGYASASAIAFQGLKAEDDPGTQPVVAPLLDYSWIGGPFDGSTLQFDGSAVGLHKSDSNDTQRITLDGTWRRPIVGGLGDVYTLIAQLRGDLYRVHDFVDPANPEAGPDSGIENRLYPLAAVEWRYPWMSRGGGIRQTIEPVVQLIATPYGLNSSSIPNEDSQTVEFDDTNLFSLNRFPGYDRVESGPRANLGFRLGAYGGGGSYATATFGQVFRAKDDDTFAEESGLDENRSDFVVGATVVPSSFFDLTYRARVDHEDLSLNRNEVYFAIGPEELRFTNNYVRLDKELSVDGLEEREELFNSVRWQIARHWAATAQSRRDLTNGGRQIRAGAGIEYLDECIGFRLTYDRDFTRDRDVEPSTSINFRVVLKHLG